MTRLNLLRTNLMRMNISSFKHQRIRQYLRRMSLLRTRIRSTTSNRSRRSHSSQRSTKRISIPRTLGLINTISLNNLIRTKISNHRHNRMSSRQRPNVLPSIQTSVRQTRPIKITRRRRKITTNRNSRIISRAKS